jgi:hypothetical protein
VYYNDTVVLDRETVRWSKVGSSFAFFSLCRFFPFLCRFSSFSLPLFSWYQEAQAMFNNHKS